MKKTIISFVILLIIGAVVFGFGYVPIRVAPGEKAFLFSRTSGWDTAPIAPGEFAWRWQLLVPRNTTVYHIPIESRRISVSSTTSLPSAELYQAYLEGTPPLRERISLRLRYRISDNGIISLAPTGFSDNTLDGWYEDFDDRLQTEVTDVVTAALQRYVSGSEETVLSEFVTAAVQERLQQRFPELVIETVIIEDLSVPDLQLYQLARETYQAIQSERRATLLELTQETTATGLLRDQRLETLARYGEILDRHPVLLEYLEIAAEHGEDPLNLRQLEAVIP